LDRFLMLFSPLVWPLATLTIALIFRRDVGQALGRIGQVKYRDLELTFRDDLRQAEQLARSIPPPAAKGTVVLEVATDEAKPLVGRLIVSPSPSEGLSAGAESPAGPAGRSPREAVEAAWGAVALTLARTSKAEGDRRAPASMNPTLAARSLVDRGRMAQAEGLLVGLLRTLRDRAVNPNLPSPSAEDARRFVDLASRVASRIEEVG
jgi:hypothetical protein